MYIDNISTYLRNILRHKPFCYKCGKIIEIDEEFEYIKIRHARGRVEHRFYHERCFKEDN
jgi:hypothetical protein